MLGVAELLSEMTTKKKGCWVLCRQIKTRLTEQKSSPSPIQGMKHRPATRISTTFISSVVPGTVAVRRAKLDISLLYKKTVSVGGRYQTDAATALR